MLFDIVPLKRIGPVHLEMTRDEARAAIDQPFEEFRKTPSSLHLTDAFFGSQFQIFYGGTNPRVEFIELCRPSIFTVVLDGIDVFGLPADEVVARVSRAVPFDSTVRDLGYSYVFPSWELAFWRPTLPETPTDDEGRYFSTVGIGVSGYFSKDAG